jgi:hypothetical protein
LPALEPEERGGGEDAMVRILGTVEGKREREQQTNKTYYVHSQSISENKTYR